MTKHAVSFWVGGVSVEVEGNVSVSFDGSEYDVELLRVRQEGRSYPVEVLTPEQRERAKDDLAEMEHAAEVKAGTLPFSLLVDVGSYRGGLV